MTKPKPKPVAVFGDHIHFGRGLVLAVRALDSSVLVADVKFDDGAERTLTLAQQYWLTDVRSLTPTPAKDKRALRAKKVAEALVS